MSTFSQQDFRDSLNHRRQDWRDRLNIERQDYVMTWPLKLAWLALLLAIIGLGALST